MKKPATTKQFKFNKATVAFVIFLMAWVTLSMTASQFVIAYPMRALLGDDAAKPFWTLVYDILLYALTLWLVLWVPPRLWRQAKRKQAQAKAKEKSTPPVDESTPNNPLTITKNELGVAEFPTFVDIGLAPIGYVAYMILATVLTTAMSVFTWFVSDQPQDVGFGYFITAGDRIMAMIALVIIAPIAEEILMRGWLYGKMRTRIGAISATLLVSLLFGLLHGQWNVAVSTFALSVVLCSLREITGTIWSGILLHMLTNGIAFYLLYIAI